MLILIFFKTKTITNNYVQLNVAKQIKVIIIIIKSYTTIYNGLHKTW